MLSSSCNTIQCDTDLRSTFDCTSFFLSPTPHDIVWAEHQSWIPGLPPSCLDRGMQWNPWTCMGTRAMRQDWLIGYSVHEPFQSLSAATRQGTGNRGQGQRHGHSVILSPRFHRNKIWTIPGKNWPRSVQEWNGLWTIDCCMHIFKSKKVEIQTLPHRRDWDEHLHWTCSPPVHRQIPILSAYRPRGHRIFSALVLANAEWGAKKAK